MYIKTKSVHFDAMTITSYVGKICLYFFLMVKDIFWWIRIKFHWGAKGRGNREYGGRSSKKGYFCNIPIFKQDTNFISKLLLRQTCNHHHWDQHAQKIPHAGTFKWFSAVLPGQKQLCVFVNICPQWCRCHRWCQWLQQGDWYSTVEGFQLC